MHFERIGFDENGCLICFCELEEKDFLPPEDDRMYSSGVCDINGGDSFEEYAEWFWREYGYEIYDDIDL